MHTKDIFDPLCDEGNVIVETKLKCAERPGLTQRVQCCCLRQINDAEVRLVRNVPLGKPKDLPTHPLLPTPHVRVCRRCLGYLRAHLHGQFTPIFSPVIYSRTNMSNFPGWWASGFSNRPYSIHRQRHPPPPAELSGWVGALDLYSPVFVHHSTNY